MKTAFDVVKAGYNAILHHGVEFVICGGKGNTLCVTPTDDSKSDILFVSVEEVEKFLYKGSD
jgi:hypothetical protein